MLNIKTFNETRHLIQIWILQVVLESEVWTFVKLHDNEINKIGML